VLGRADIAEIAAEARAGGMVDMRGDGLVKVAAGETSLDEVLRVTGMA
jgi:type II secretory ATPase GspE/PulE/Tfp pilus assembly ATPase PilB-like protein